MTKSRYTENVFYNYPFDEDYKPIFNAVVFTIHDCGFRARCAIETHDSSDVRIDKIYKIISECKYGIHDISLTDPDDNTGLPRFNMPFELGIFLGVKKFGGKKHSRKVCLTLDIEKYRYQRFLSDISGQDISGYNGDPKKASKEVRNWLLSSSDRKTLPGANFIWNRYEEFQLEYPTLCDNFNLDPSEIIFNDYVLLVSEWLKINGYSDLELP